jgi:hypothetical protein
MTTRGRVKPRKPVEEHVLVKGKSPIGEVVDVGLKAIDVPTHQKDARLAHAALFLLLDEVD